jgi:hypothetical protein
MQLLTRGLALLTPGLGDDRLERAPGGTAGITVVKGTRATAAVAAMGQLASLGLHFLQRQWLGLLWAGLLHRG